MKVDMLLKPVETNQNKRGLSLCGLMDNILHYDIKVSSNSVHATEFTLRLGENLEIFYTHEQAI